MKPPQIELLCVEHAHKLALQRGHDDLKLLLRVSIPDHWPQFPEAFAVSAATPPAAENAWPPYFFIHRAENALVGNGGIFVTSSSANVVEIGYEIAPLYHNRGMATAAVKALLKIAFAQSEICAVVANTLAEKNASNAVLRKVGMEFVAAVPNEEVGTVWRYQLARENFTDVI
jgi:RimJ/RimL family protein N-acetyltransferase